MASTVERTAPERRGVVLLGEIVALVALVIADARGLVPFSRAPFLVLLCWVSLGLRRLTWRALSGFWLGVLFLAGGRNVTAPIVAHGVSNTLALVLTFLDRYPGV